MEAFWDAKAKDFSHKQNSQKDEIPEKVSKFLRDDNYLHKKANILDIGGGSGRYALHMAKSANKVTLTDISTNMLKHAQENAERDGVNNIEYVKLDFKRADIKQMAWERKFDHVFAIMCPAVRSAKDLDKMISVSKGSCFIGQFVERTDTITSKIMQALNISKQGDPHNDREAVYAFYNILWLKGYNPAIRYFKEEITDEFSLNEVKASYADKYSDLAIEQGTSIEEVIANLFPFEKIKVNSNQTLALISWEID